MSDEFWKALEGNMSELKKRYPESTELSPEFSAEVASMDEFMNGAEFKKFTTSKTLNMKKYCFDMTKSNVIGNEEVIKTMKSG